MTDKESVKSYLGGPAKAQRESLRTAPLQVCDTMVMLKDLQSWELFYAHVGEVVDSPNIQPIARQLVELCCHNTHAILLMARALRSVNNIDTWNDALQRLSLQPASHEQKLQNLYVNVLKFSHERLEDDITRNCLRKCREYRHDAGKGIAPESLINLWIRDGLVHTHDEGNELISKLIDANLLERSTMNHGLFVKLRILINLIIRSERGGLFLLRGGLGLTEAAEDEEWENAIEIQLMGNDLSELPDNPRCPILSALFLERNYNLTKIPSSFFEYMPALEVLNLSETGIKSLPESLFGLVNLKRLLLKGCHSLMMLSPKVGKLVQLEVLDLEYTEIIDLPTEIKELTKLKCLIVSLYNGLQSKTLLLCGIISALTLKELKIDVSPDDKQWGLSVATMVNEVCSLTRLSIIEIYFPSEKLWSRLVWDRPSMIDTSLSHFMVHVGHHKRIKLHIFIGPEKRKNHTNSNVIEGDSNSEPFIGDCCKIVMRS